MKTTPSPPGIEAEAPASRRGRPRSETARHAILEAAAELLMARGLAAMNMGTVAARAGVSKATIYRRWRTKELLALDALFHAWSEGVPPARSTGHLRADLFSVLRPWVKLLRTRPYGHVIAALIAEAHTNAGFAEVYRTRFVFPRREQARGIFRQALEHSNTEASETDIDLALDLLYGPIYHRLFHGHAPLDEQFLHAVIESAVAVLERAPAEALRL
jgi:AcrR family transcriptional regulator